MDVVTKRPRREAGGADAAASAAAVAAATLPRDPPASVPISVPPGGAAAAPAAATGEARGSKPAKGVATARPPKLSAAAQAAAWSARLAVAARAFHTHKHSRRVYRLWQLSGVDPQWLLQRNVRILWPADNFAYAATVDSYDSAEGTHCVTYADGTEEWVRVGEEECYVQLAPGEEPPLLRPAPPAGGAPQSEAQAERAVVEGLPGGVPEGLDAVGTRLSVHFPATLSWADGAVDAFDGEQGTHRISYDAGGSPEWLTLASECVRCLGPGGRRGAALGCTPQGTVLWGRVKGYPYWPCLVVGDADALKACRLRKSEAAPLAVQYFGSAEHGRLGITPDVCLSFEDGLAADCVRKGGAAAAFQLALAQLEEYLSSGTLSDKMGGKAWPDAPDFESDDEDAEPPLGSAAAFWADAAQHLPREDPSLPWTLSAQLTVERLGRIEYIRPSYHNPKFMYPIGFCSIRTETGPLGASWRCEVVDGGDAPLFKVTGPLNADGSAPHGARVVQEAHPTVAWAAAMEASGASITAAVNANPRRKAAEMTPPAGAAAGAQRRGGGTSGAEMFGLTHKRVTAALQRLPDAPRCVNYQARPDVTAKPHDDVTAHSARALLPMLSQLTRPPQAWEGGMRPRPPPPNAAQVLAAAARAAAHLRLPPGISPVLMPPPPDRCSVCDLAVEWDDDQLVQCDACSLLVHMRCYGIRDLPDGSAWSCAACSLRLAAPPPCALCPVVGGAMKRSTCGRWCHVACAQWIPETSFVDSDLVEPVDGIGKVGKARLALKCGLCRQGYGACIQCAGGRHCYATYHPLCARGRGYVMEVREAAGGGNAAKAASRGAAGGASRKRPAAGALDDKAVTGLGDGLFLASFCPKCAPRAAAAAAGGSAPARATPVKGAKASKKAQAAAQRPPRPRPPRPQLFSAQQALPDLSACGVPGCARTVPLDWSLRRLRREPAAITAFLAKRAFVEATPYVVTGRRHVLALAPRTSSLSLPLPPTPAPLPAAEAPEAAMADDAPGPDAAAPVPALAASAAERYAQMRASLRARLTCGKSSIHGWGCFTKTAHPPNSMVIEYVGQLIRPALAEHRERTMYDALVGAGTYVFRRDHLAVVDATRTGNMAHLINHSCAPNCYSRLVTVGEVAHIVLFALREIRAGEELSYDYRFSSEQERLACNCAAPSCRGWVNVSADEEDEEPGGHKLPEGWRWARKDAVTVVGKL